MKHLSAKAEKQEEAPKPAPFRYWKPEVLTPKFVAAIVVLAAQRGYDQARMELNGKKAQ